MNNLWDSLPEDLKKNPYFQFSEDTNFVPPWDRIKTSDFEAAMKFALENMTATVAKITLNKAKPTFKNTVQPIEEAFGLAGYFYRIFFSLTPANAADDKERQRVEKAIGREWYNTFVDAFNFAPLFLRFHELCTPEKMAKWSKEEQAIASMFFATFAEVGINLEPEKKKAYNKMSMRIYELGNDIQQKMRDAGEHVMLFVSDESYLKGVPQDMIDRAAIEAAENGQPGKWAFLANRVIHEALMVTAEDRQLREDMWKLYHKKRMVGPFNTSAQILQFTRLTYDAAKLKTGRKPSAEILKFNMARDPKTVSDFLLKLRNAAKPVAMREMEILSTFAKNNLNIRTLKPWDLSFVEEKVKKSIFGFDDQDTRVYFELENTLEKMVFPHFRKQLGLQFRRAENYPSYDPDVRAYDLYTRAGRHMGVLFLDLYDRPGKMSGVAWSMSVLSQGMFDGKVRRPVNQINMKLTKPAPGQPTLMTHSEVTTLEHELGHSIHDLVSECKFQSRSGTGVDTDFVEFPSQFQEYIAYLPEFLKNARHHETGAPMPDDMVQKLSESRKFMAGRRVLERAMRGWLDLQWHNRNPNTYTSVKGFEDEVLKSFKLPGLEYPLYSPAFSYTFGGGYDCSFYGYQWAEVMSADLIEISKRKGLYDKELTRKFSRTLAAGGIIGEIENYKALAGRTPNLNPMLRATGLLGKAFNYAAALEKQPVPANDTAPAAEPKTPRVA